MGGSKAFMSYSQDNRSLKDVWIDQGGAFVKVEGLKATEAPDITVWNSANLVLSPKAFDLLHDELNSDGEFLPITINGSNSYVFNCLNVVEVDPSASEADIVNGLWMGIKKLGFSEGDVSSNLIFKTSFDRCSALYCGEAFRTLIEKHQLTGLLFLKDLVNDF